MNRVQESYQDGWQAGAKAAKMTLLGELNVYLDQAGWTYTEAEQDELETIALQIEKAQDSLAQAVEKLNNKLDSIRTGR